MAHRLLWRWEKAGLELAEVFTGAGRTEARKTTLESTEDLHSSLTRDGSFGDPWDLRGLGVGGLSLCSARHAEGGPSPFSWEVVNTSGSEVYLFKDRIAAGMRPAGV